MNAFQRVSLALGTLLVYASSAFGSGVSPNILVLPHGPGSIGGVGENIQPNLNMGLMSYPINILVPKGRGDATPPVSISYSSSAGAGKMGIGWTLNAGASIERLTVRGLPKYDNTDRFYAGGELVKLPGTPFYRARVEGGFVRYQWKQSSNTDQQGHWIAEYPDGSKGYFGADDKGKADPNSQVTGLKGTYKWELVTMVDRNGNRVRYTYTKQASQTYLDQISYVFDKSGQALYQINFLYGRRPDPISDGKPGFDVQTRQRLEGITITSDGQRFRSYQFHFEDATGLSRLIKVERFGRDKTKRHPVHFTMKYSNATFSPQNSRMITMPTSLGVNFKNGNTDFLDINGDGLPDVVDTSNPKHVFHINRLTLTPTLQQKTHDFPQTLRKENPQETSAKLSNPSVQLMDFNGDGFTDLVDAVGQKIYINKGNGRWEDRSEALVSFPTTQGDPNIRFLDYNGDKKIDIIRSDGKGTSYWINDGQGSWKPITGNTNIGKSFSADRLRLIDINGDGLQDVVHITSSSLRYRKYLGYGNWSEWINMIVPGIDKYPLSKDAQFNDINGDGLADMVAFLGKSIVYFVNQNGMAFAPGKELQAFGGIDIPDSTQSSIRIADINGNGSRDIVWIDSSGKVTYLELFSKRPNLMTEISNGIGQRINVAYGSSVYYYLRDNTCDKAKDKACAGPWQNQMPMAFTVVTKITTWASRSDKPADQKEPTKTERPQVQSMYYHSGFYDGKEKKFRGFRHVETLYDGDPAMGARKDEITFDVGDTRDYMHGRMLQKTITDGAGKLYRRVSYKWDTCPIQLGGIDATTLLPPIHFICSKSVLTELIEGKPNAARTLSQAFQYDGYGNTTEINNAGEKDKDGDEQIIKVKYITPTNPNDANAPWLIRYPRQRETCSRQSGPCAAIEYFYDGEAYKGLPAGQITKGNLTRTTQAVLAGATDVIERQRTSYDAYGNVIGTLSPTGLERVITWDQRFQRFSETETIKMKGYDLVAKTQWDYAYNRVIQSTDYNGHITRYAYDLFNRLSEIYQPKDKQGEPSTKYTYEIQSPLSRIIRDVRSRQGAPFDQKTIQCFDGLGRRLATLGQVKPGIYLVTGHQEYTREGQVARTWKTYQSTSEVCAFTAPNGTPSTTFAYDGMRRLIQSTFPDASSSRIVYEPLKQIAFDPEDNDRNSPHFDTPSITLSDGLGRIIESQIIPSKGNVLSTKYTYSNAFVDGISRTLSITYPDGSQKTQTYDLQGDVIKVTDPDRSTIEYTYNKDKLPISKKDATGTIVEYTYDGLRRIVRIQKAQAPETAAEYIYDNIAPENKEATNVKGNIVAIKYPHGAYYFSYDERGNRTEQRHDLFGTKFRFATTFTNSDQANVFTYPNGTKLTYTLDGINRVTGVPGYIKSLAYNPLGQLKSWTANNDIKTTITYDKRHRTAQIDVAEGKIFSLSYQYDKSFNPTQWKQKHGGVNFDNTYQYDNLYRLTQANVGPDKETLQFQQDALSNLLAKISSLGNKSPAHVEAYSYSKTHIHQATKAGPTSFAYDKAGRMTKSGAFDHKWDFMGRRTHASRGGSVTGRYWYNHLYERTIKEENGHHVFYIDKRYEIREGAIVSYIWMWRDRQIAIWSVKGVDTFFDDLAPAAGNGKTLKATPDGVINAADAWLYHANRQSMVTITTKQRPIDLDLTKDMLMSSVNRLLLGANKAAAYTYHLDHLGSVRAVTDDAGKVVKRTHYYPYGAIRAQEGQRQLFTHGFQNTELDTLTSTNYFGLRSLDAKTGKWMRTDPAFARIASKKDELNSYGLTLNNPLRYRDLQGASSAESFYRETFTKPTPHNLIGGVVAPAISTAILAYILSNRQRRNEFGNMLKGFALTVTLGPIQRITGRQLIRQTHNGTELVRATNRITGRNSVAGAIEYGMRLQQRQARARQLGAVNPTQRQLRLNDALRVKQALNGGMKLAPTTPNNNPYKTLNQSRLGRATGAASNRGRSASFSGRSRSRSRSASSVKIRRKSR